MSIRRDAISRNIEARKASVPTIAKGKPLDARGSEGDMAFRRTSGGLKLYIKANHKWHGVKVGESFDSLEKKINEIKSKVDTIKQFRLPSTYSVTGDFTLDASGDIELNADDGRVSIKDDTASRFLFDGTASRFKIFDHVNTNDYFTIQVNDEGATTLTTYDADTAAAHLSLIADGNITLDAVGDIEINADGGQVRIKDDTTSHFIFDCDNTSFKIYDDASINDYFSITVTEDGETTIATNEDGVGETGHLTLDVDGNIELNADGGLISFKDDSVDICDFGPNTINVYHNSDSGDFFRIGIATHGATTFYTTDDDAAAAHLTLAPDGSVMMIPDQTPSQGVIVDYNTTHTTNKTCSALYVDTDQTGIIASGQTLSITGMDNRLNTDSPTMVGTVDSYGIKNWVVGGTSGTQAAYGIYNIVSGADTNIGIYNNVTDGHEDLRFVSSANTSDYFKIITTTDGATTLSTVDADSADAHMTLQPDGDLVLDPVSKNIIINATDKLYFDGGTHTYIYEDSDNSLTFVAGAVTLLNLTAGGSSLNEADFKSTAVGMTQGFVIYNATDTTVYFSRAGNKQFLTFGSGNITDMNLIFPNMSGNFVLLVKQDGTGSRTVTNWKTFDQDSANESTVKWAGGSAPTLTTDANHVDILSFYWDNANHIAYGVATLDFQF